MHDGHKMAFVKMGSGEEFAHFYRGVSEYARELVETTEETFKSRLLPGLKE
jgi:hypothetical protein